VIAPPAAIVNFARLLPPFIENAGDSVIVMFS